MTLVDTSAWIEWLIGSPTGERLSAYLPEQANWLMPTMVQLELDKWLQREVGEQKADQVIAFTQMCRIVYLDTDIALLASALCRTHKLATADAVIFATAKRHNARLVTCDAHFKGLPNVDLIEKTSP